MKFMIPVTKYAHIYSITDNKIKLLEFRQFNQHTLTSPGSDFSADLPGELILMILKHTFVQLIRDFNFEQASALATINKEFTAVVYHQIYGRSNHLSTTYAFRINHALYLAESIYDDYLSMPMAAPRVILRTELVSRNTPKILAPWDFSNNLYHERMTLNTFNQGRINSYSLGPLNGDNLWAFGKSSQGIINGHFYHPVIILAYASMTDELVLKESDFWRNHNFANLARLFKCIFGPTTGLFFMIKNQIHEDNPFITLSDHLHIFQ